MHANISVQIGKALQTNIRNMRRRKNNSWTSSPIPFVFAIALFAWFKTKDPTSVTNNIPVPATSQNVEHQVVVKNEQPRHVVTAEKRQQYMDRRQQERRALHRRIVENQIGMVEEHQAMKKHHHKSTKITETGEASTVARQEDLQQASEHSRKSAEVASDKSHIPRVYSKPVKPDRGNRTQKTTTAGIPAGARVHGKLADYGGSLGGTTDGMIRGQNVTRVSYTLFKIMKLFGFVTLVDSPAGSHAEWMPELVERMSFDHPSFRYIGVDNAAGVGRARERIGDLVDGEFVVGDAETVCGKGADVVFYWTEMDGGERDARSERYAQHIRRVMLAAKEADNGYIIFAQYPSLNGPQPQYRKGQWVFVGDDKPPFLYNRHVRGVVPVGNGRESYMPYMTFYSLRSIPINELQEST